MARAKRVNERRMRSIAITTLVMLTFLTRQFPNSPRGSSRAFRSLSKPFEAFWKPFEAFRSLSKLGAFRSLSKPFEAFRRLSKPFEVFRSLSKPFEARSLSKPFEAFRSFSKPFEAFRSLWLGGLGEFSLCGHRRLTSRRVKRYLQLRPSGNEKPLFRTTSLTNKTEP